MMSHPEFTVVTYGALEMEAASALIMLRYQFEDQEAENMVAVCSSNTVVVAKRTPKEPSTCSKSHQRSILKHLQPIPDAAKMFCMSPEQWKLVYDYLENKMI